MAFPRQEYSSGFLFSSPGDLPHPEIELASLMTPVSPTLQDDSLPLSPKKHNCNCPGIYKVAKVTPRINYRGYGSDSVQEDLYRDSEELCQMLTRVFSGFGDYKHLLMSLYVLHIYFFIFAVKHVLLREKVNY